MVLGLHEEHELGQTGRKIRRGHLSSTKDKILKNGRAGWGSITKALWFGRE